MALFKLLIDNEQPEQGELAYAAESKLEFEKHLENWLENSPWAIALETLLIIGRQTTATVVSQTLYPDLIALDKDGALVVIELKKGRTPREVVAQILEYAAWANNLSQEDVLEMANKYLSDVGKVESVSLSDIFCDTFEEESMPPLNQHRRLFIASEEIAPAIINVCEYLRTSHSVDVTCIEFSSYETESGEILISREIKVGMERPKTTITGATERWSGEKPVHEVISDAIEEYTSGDKTIDFAPKDIKTIVMGLYPDFKKSNVGARITADCVNHSSRHHYPGGKDLYWKVGKGRFKLYDPNTDKHNAVAGM